MGKLLQGINGPFSGKVGTVVGYMWNDVAVIRVQTSKRTKPFSDKELNQQARFALMNQFLIPVKESAQYQFCPSRLPDVWIQQGLFIQRKSSHSGFQA